MDEVDIDNVEDLNELEARLYAQIHHEATNEPIDETIDRLTENKDQQIHGTKNSSANYDNEQNYETSYHTNKILSRRYWSSGDNSLQQQEQQHQQNKQRFIRNPFKTSNPETNQQKKNDASSTQNKSHNQNQTTKQTKSDACNLSQSFTTTIENLNTKTDNAVSTKTVVEKPSALNTEKISNSWIASKCTMEETATSIEPTSNENNTNVYTKADHNIKQKSTPAIEKSNLKLNPLAHWTKRNKQQPATKKSINKNNKNIQTNATSLISRTSKEGGPFGKQQQKLEKAKRLEDKKQKSKKAKNTAAAIAKKIECTEIINLDSDSGSDSSDVIMVPIPPPPTFTVEDSGDEDNENNTPITLEHEENALDSTDVQMSTNSSISLKPQTIGVQSSPDSIEGSVEKRLENSSRCTSPCSIQSSDDFIGQNDRSRLLTDASGMADDEDLLLLTSDINSLLEAPQTLKTSVHNEKISDNEDQQQGFNVEKAQGSIKTNDSLEVATPKSSKHQKRSTEDYRVGEGQFRALDVYESESDITDSVYSKGARNPPTVIRQIDTSSDELEEIGSSCSSRTKRLRKRRASSSNRGSDVCIENVDSSSDEENEYDEDVDDNNVLRTPIPFIARGLAVERCKPRKRSRTLSTCSPIAQKKKSVNRTGSAGHMSDNEFIATINNLAQGQEEEKKENQEMDGDDSSEVENVPTARDMAEKILTQRSLEKDAKKANEDIAIPEDILSKLDKIFETIDKMDSEENKRTQFSTPDGDGVLSVSDSSDSDIEKRLRYKTVPNDDTQIIKISPYSSRIENTPIKTRTDSGSPIYNVVYSRGQTTRGGLGWNTEMRRFYNDSWNGERFALHKVLRKMNPDKRLWKIYTEDRFNIKRNKRNLKCTNCYEFGHMRSKCKRPRKPMICYMCGESGHQEPRCPNTICLRCGTKTQVFTKSCNSCSYQDRLMCPICKVRGHSLDYCPDKWRRYHSTTEPNVIPNNCVYYNPHKYCCICGARGHLSDSCRSAVRFMQYPTIVTTIKSHQKSYGDVPMKAPYNGIGLNLMYEPCQEYDFELVQRTTLDKYYGRFLRAVGLDFLLNRQPRIETSVSKKFRDTSAKKTKRLSEKYVANPYSKIGAANQQNTDPPNQVQEITESGNCIDNYEKDKPVVVNDDVINVGGNNSENKVELIDTSVNDITENIQLNTINDKPTAVERSEENFKSPKNIASSAVATTSNTAVEPLVVLDSDSNYSFSEHFELSSQVAEKETLTQESQVDKPIEEVSTLTQKPRAMNSLPDFIPLVHTNEENYTVEDKNDNESTVAGISKRFVPAETDEEMDDGEHTRRPISPLPELPCEAKIYLNHSHSTYLLSPAGNTFLVKNSRNHKLKARLDFTSVGYVLVIFGLPSNQEKFQRELLLKYRELADENNQKQYQTNLNVPKRSDVLIRFLRDNITQLLNNLGNANQLLKRLHFLERQQSKSGYKLAEKVRRSLNMILVGQAGLKDGTMHLDKLLTSLKILTNDYNGDDVAPPQLRSEIIDHWKVIFTSYRHDNYQKLVDTYNTLISKNCMPKLIIDPILLGQKVLDTSFSENQKQKLEQTGTSTAALNESTNVEPAAKVSVLNPFNQKNSKKRKQNSDATNTASNASTSETAAAANNKAKTSTSRPNSPKKSLQTPSTSVKANNSSSPSNVKSTLSTTPFKIKAPGNSSTPVRTKTPNSTTSMANKTKTTGGTPATPNTATKKQSEKIMPPPAFANPEKRSTINNKTIQKVSDKWRSTCDTLLMEISSDKPSTTKGVNDGRLCDSKLQSIFWSRESIRYLNDCVRLASTKQDAVMEKLKRVQNKAKSGQLSYNDYLAVIKLHTALCGK